MRSNAEAVAVVDSAAPIDSTLKALKPDGWSGCRGSDEEIGAVYAVWKDEIAVGRHRRTAAVRKGAANRGTHHRQSPALVVSPNG